MGFDAFFIGTLSLIPRGGGRQGPTQVWPLRDIHLAHFRPQVAKRPCAQTLGEQRDGILYLSLFLLEMHAAGREEALLWPLVVGCYADLLFFPHITK